MQTQSLAPRSSKIQDFDVELQVLHEQMQKQVVTIVGPFLSFMLTFHEHKAHKLLNLMLNLHFEGLKIRLKVNMIGMGCLCFQYMNMYLNLNPIVAIKVVPFAMNSEESTSLYDFKKIDK